MGVLEEPWFWWGTGASAGLYTVVAALQLYSLLRGRMSVLSVQSGIGDGSIEYVIDVRTAAEWNAGHLSGAVHIPFAQIPTSRILKQIPKSARILVHCRTGKRARQAAAQLRNAGYQDVHYTTADYRSIRG